MVTRASALKKQPHNQTVKHTLINTFAYNGFKKYLKMKTVTSCSHHCDIYFLNRTPENMIGREETPGCHHCGDSPEDTVEHTVAVCPAWAEHRRVLVAAIGGGDLSPSGPGPERENGKQSSPSAKPSCWRRRWQNARGAQPLVPAAARYTPGVGRRLPVTVDAGLWTVSNG